MLTVAINSSTVQTSVALIDEGKVCGKKSWISDRDEAEKILPNIAGLLTKAKKRWNDIGQVFVVKGPGPFTGLRVGVTIANALAMSVGCRIKTADVFEYLRVSIPERLRAKTAIVVKGGGEYVALFLPSAKKEKLLKTRDLPGILKKTAVKRLLAEMNNRERAGVKKLLKTQKISVSFLDKKELKPFAQAAVELMKRTKKTSKIVQPGYLQKPHITQSKKPTFAAVKK